MAIQIPVPAGAYSEVELSVAGISYTFVYRFNSRFKKYEDDLGTWVIDILNSDREYVIKGLAVVGQGRLLSGLVLPEFDHGDILCVKNKKTDAAPTRENLGFDNEYVLVYVTNEELANGIG